MWQQMRTFHSDNKKNNVINFNINDSPRNTAFSIKITENYNIKPTDNIILVDSLKKITVSLPELKESKTYIIKDIRCASKNNISINCINKNAKIDDAKSILLNSDFESITLYTDGLNYYIL
jgi:hypothetical protein